METRAAVARFLDSPGLSDATRQAYGFDLEAFAGWLDTRGAGLEGVDVPLLSDYAAELGRGRPRRLAPATIARRLAAVRSFLAYTLGPERVPDASLAPRRARRLPDVPKADELEQLLAGLEGDTPLHLRNR